MRLKIFISISIVLLLSSLGFWLWFRSTKVYDYMPPDMVWVHECYTKQNPKCCLSSVDAMRAGNYRLAEDGACPPNTIKNSMLCADSLIWCQPAVPTSSSAFVPSLPNISHDWQTYRNSEIGVQFEYPSAWGVRYVDKKIVVTSDKNNEPHDIDPEKDSYFSVYLRDKLSSTSTLSAWFKNISSTADPVPSEVAITTINNHSAIRALLSFPGTKDYLYFIDNNGAIYELDQYVNSRYESAYQHILSTFRFIP